MRAPLRVDDSLLAAWHASTSRRVPRTRETPYLRDLGALQALAGDGRARRALVARNSSLSRHAACPRSFGRQPCDGCSRRGARSTALRSTAIRSSRTIPARDCGHRNRRAAFPSALSPDEAVQLVAIDGNDDSLTLRDRALFELAYSSGLRVSELAGLAVAALDLAAGEVRVWGKGAKERVVPVGAPAREALHTWLARRPTLSRGEESAVFLSRTGRRLTAARDPAAAGGLGDQARTFAPRASAHAATFVCVARAAVLGRPARGAGAAGAREHRQHADLHAPRFPGAGEDAMTARIRARRRKQSDSCAVL